VGRYETFERETYSALQELGKHFIYNFINAQGSYAEVENNIIKEMEYQSSTELQPETHDAIHSLLRSDEAPHHPSAPPRSWLECFTKWSEHCGAMPCRW